MNNTFAFLKAIALGLMLFSNAVVAGEPPTPGDAGPPRPEHLMRKMRGMSGMMLGGQDYTHTMLRRAKDIKLTDEQRQKIMEIQGQYQEKGKTHFQRLNQAMATVRKGLLEPTVDEAAIHKASKEHATALEAMIESGLKIHREVDAVLTAEQIDQLQSHATPKIKTPLSSPRETP
jgi:Spy/CpxP family protein refolding chaperone